MTSAAAWLVLKNRQITISKAEVMAESIRDTAAVGVDNLVTSMDLSLQGVQEGFELSERFPVPQQVKRAMLFDKSATAKPFGALYVLDEKGMVVADLKDSDPYPPVSRANRPAFQAHVDNDAVGLFIDQPRQRPDGGRGIPFSRRLHHGDGSFAGVAVGPLLINSLVLTLSQLPMPGVSVILMKSDGTLLARSPAVADRLGQSLQNYPILKLLRDQPRGTKTIYDTIDGTPRVVSYVALSTYPLVVRVAYSIDAVLADWRMETVRYAGIGAILMLTQLFLTWMVWQELGRRLAAEQEQRALAREMEVLAHQDSLTQLPNRRNFEKQLRAEATRISREQKGLAVLMIDIDHFKQVNDRLGHQAGDAALADIADCIARSLHRASDYAARFAGDEFAVILPATDKHGALEVAERIRQNIESMNFQVAGQLLTVSIGYMACAQANPDTAALISKADEALYRAKHQGRNRVVAFEEAQAGSE